jgi:conjugal transfer mating pair stabilization protein TraG
MSLPEERVTQMVLDHVAEKEMVQRTQTMPTATLSGASLNTSASLPKQDIAQQHQRNISQIGYINTQPIEIDTDAPFTAAKNTMTNKLSTTHPESIAARAQSLKDNVHAWSSPDKKIGEGRANPMGVVEEMEYKDAVDYMRKVIDKFVGGEGVADGERLNNHQKNELGSPIQYSTQQLTDEMASLKEKRNTTHPSHLAKNLGNENE